MFCPKCGSEVQHQSLQVYMACGAPTLVPGPPDNLPVRSGPVRADSPRGAFLELGRVDVGMMTFLSTITFGIYFMVWL